MSGLDLLKESVLNGASGRDSGMDMGVKCLIQMTVNF